MAELLKGAAVAAAMSEELARRVRAMEEQGIFPKLAIVRLGEEPGDLAYERGALKRCAALGIRTEQVILPRTAATDEVLRVLEGIGRDGSVHGCLLLRPLPDQVDAAAVRAALPPEKDVDSITDCSACRVYTGEGPGFEPCTPRAVIELLDYYGVALSGARVAVIGRSAVVGRPLALMLQRRDATVTVCHSKTRDLAGICRQQDILISAAGRIGTVDGRCVWREQVVVDVGVNAGPGGKITGDVLFDQVEPLVRAITPVPGGVGAVTSTVLAAHVVEAAQGQAFLGQD